MSKDEMINWLLRDIESDRFRRVEPASAESAQQLQASEWSRLNARSHGEIEVLYFTSEEAHALSA